MKRSVAILFASLGAFGVVACSDGLTDVTKPSYTIDMPGNVSECGTIDFANCWAKVDFQFKLLYEQNNYYARSGEALYDAASGSNNELANIFDVTSTSVKTALSELTKFESEVQNYYAKGGYSDCAEQDLLSRAQWLYNKISTGNTDLSDAPVFPNQCVSPVASVTGTATATAGVTLTVDDPWHYAGPTPYGIGDTQTYFIVERLDGTTWTVLTQTAPTQQTGPATLTFTDPASNVAGTTYTYRVTQCDGVHCSVATVGTVSIDAGGSSGGDGGGTTCTAHDNSVHDAIDNNNKLKDKCSKVAPGQTK